MPNTREAVFAAFVILGLAVLVYGLASPSNNAIFLATAVGSLGYAVLALWQNYASQPKLEIEKFEMLEDINAITLTAVDPQSGLVPFKYRQIRVKVTNQGRKTARGCTDWIELVERPAEGCTMFTRQPAILQWVALPEGGRQIAPHGGFGLLGVANSIDSPLGLPPGRCKIPGAKGLHTWANTEDFWKFLGKDLLQYIFCPGNWIIRITIYSDTAAPVSRAFTLKVGTDPHDLSMFEIIPQEKPLGRPARLRPFAAKLRTLLDALVIFSGVFLSRELQDNALLFAYLFVTVLAVAIVVRIVLFLSGKKGPAITVGVMVGKVIEWFLHWGEEFSIGVGLAILLSAGLTNWGGWVLFSVFFGLAVEMIYVGELVKGFRSPTGPRVPTADGNSSRA